MRSGARVKFSGDRRPRVRGDVVGAADEGVADDAPGVWQDIVLRTRVIYSRPPVVAINALGRLPDLRLDPTAPYPSIDGVAFRSPAALPVEFTPG